MHLQFGQRFDTPHEEESPQRMKRFIFKANPGYWSLDEMLGKFSLVDYLSKRDFPQKCSYFLHTV